MKVGERYMTRGGWEALIIWVYDRPSVVFSPDLSSLGVWHCYAVHKPGSPEESPPVCHQKDGRAIGTFGVGQPPIYGGHPADLMLECYADENAL